MRILVTGGHGFVGRYLQAELASAGHEVVAPAYSVLDVVDQAAVAAAVDRYTPDAIAHLAAVAFGPDVQQDPLPAFELAVAGTANVLESARRATKRPIVLVTGSAEVYSPPGPAGLPIMEDHPLRPRSPYAVSKLAQESVGIAYADRYGLTVIVTRAFNHSGAGQRPAFVVPALAERVLAVATGRAPSVQVGNLDVRRDFTHVLDVVRAYRALLEVAHDGRLAKGVTVVNVASGRATAIGELLDQLCRLAQVTPAVQADPQLIRADDPPEIRGDATALLRLTGWQPQHTVEEIVGDVWQAAVTGRA